MSASTTVLVNIQTVITNGPNAATLAKAILAAGPIQDYVGNTYLLQKKFQEAKVLLTAVKSVTDGSDPNITNINAVLAALNGTSGPSATYITDLKALVAPTAASKALAIAAAGPIMDIPGNINAVIVKFEEAAVLLGPVITVTDSTDSANLALLQNIQTGCS